MSPISIRSILIIIESGTPGAPGPRSRLPGSSAAASPGSARESSGAPSADEARARRRGGGETAPETSDDAASLRVARAAPARAGLIILLVFLVLFLIILRLVFLVLFLFLLLHRQVLVAHPSRSARRPRSADTCDVKACASRAPARS